MGQPSKFPFSLPGRKHKTAGLTSPPPISAPLTKVQKILGTAAINIDSPTLLNPNRAPWDAQPSPGLGVVELGGEDQSQRHGHRGRWDDTSAASIDRPETSNSRHHAIESPGLTRRQSSSTITSHHENRSASAAASGLPSKAQALLDIDGTYTNNVPPPLNNDSHDRDMRKARKKPSKLDLSALLPGHKSSKNRDRDRDHRADSSRGHYPDNDATDSRSSTPPPILQRADRKIRKILTKESLRDRDRDKQTTPVPTSAPPAGPNRQYSANNELHNLYDHYEQRTFADAMDRQLQGLSAEYSIGSLDSVPEWRSTTETTATTATTATSASTSSLPPTTANNASSGKAFLSPFPQPVNVNVAASARAKMQQPVIPSSPIMPDCASVSSRHTRTSRASKRTERSLNEIDLLQNSVLALSSDSEDDFGGTSPRDSFSNTGDCIGPKTGAGLPVTGIEAGFARPAKRTSFLTSTQYLPSSHPSEVSATPTGPKILPRSSSLAAKKLMAKQLAGLVVTDNSRLSVGTASTDKTERIVVPEKDRKPKKIPSESDFNQFNFPTPPTTGSMNLPTRGRRSVSVSRALDHHVSQLLSPGMVVDMYLQSPYSPPPEIDGPRSATSLGIRRGSESSSINDEGAISSNGRFMAVTRQEEMLLSALRMKRARMREDIIAELEEDAAAAASEKHDSVSSNGNGNGNGGQLRRQITNESIATSMMSRQSSWSTMRAAETVLSARPRQGSTGRIVLERRDTSGSRSGASSIVEGDEPTLGEHERRGSKSSTTSSRRNQSISSTRPARDGSLSRLGSDQTSTRGQQKGYISGRIPEEPVEEEVGVPRPDSPISPSPADFPVPNMTGSRGTGNGMKGNKQVRLSAVGY